MAYLKIKKLRFACAAACLAAGFGLAQSGAAAPLLDPAGDFLPTYTGPQNGDLDVLSVEAIFNGSSFMLSSLLADRVGITPGALYVWGIDRGTGTEVFVAGVPSIGAGVKFDAVAVFRPDGTGLVALLQPAGPPILTNLAADSVDIFGSFIAGKVPLALLPSTGFDPKDYRFNLWPRTGNGNALISDFAPDASTFAATFVPEPMTWTMMLIGFGATGAAIRRRRVIRVARC
jgi:hypothetical protein